MPSVQVFETWGFLWFAIGATASCSFLVGSATNRNTVLTTSLPNLTLHRSLTHFVRQLYDQQRLLKGTLPQKLQLIDCRSTQRRHGRAPRINERPMLYCRPSRPVTSRTVCAGSLAAGCRCDGVRGSHSHTRLDAPEQTGSSSNEYPVYHSIINAASQGREIVCCRITSSGKYTLGFTWKIGNSD